MTDTQGDDAIMRAVRAWAGMLNVEDWPRTETQRRYAEVERLVRQLQAERDAARADSVRLREALAQVVYLYDHGSLFTTAARCAEAAIGASNAAHDALHADAEAR